MSEFHLMIDLARELNSRFEVRAAFEFGTASQHYDVLCRFYVLQDGKETTLFSQYGPASQIVQTLRKQIEIRET